MVFNSNHEEVWKFAFFFFWGDSLATSVVGERGYEPMTRSSGARGLDEVGQMVGEVHRTQGSTWASFAGCARLAVDVEAVL